MKHAAPSSFLWYGFAVGLVAAAEAFRTYVSSRWEMPHWLIIFIPVVMASAWFGGLGPGLVSTVASALVVMYVELPPRLSIRVEDASELIGVVLLIGIGVVLSVLARKDRG
jgi:K+-sensing histidine kinase KdpD